MMNASCDAAVCDTIFHPSPLQWILDVLVCNWLGLFIGMKLCSLFEMQVGASWQLKRMPVHPSHFSTDLRMDRLPPDPYLLGQDEARCATIHARDLDQV